MIIELANSIKPDSADNSVELIEKMSAMAFRGKSPNLMYNYVMVLRYALSGCSFGVMVSRIICFLGFKESQVRMARCLEFLDAVPEKANMADKKSSENILINYVSSFCYTHSEGTFASHGVCLLLVASASI